MVVSGRPFSDLAASIRKLSAIPSQVAAAAAEKIEAQIQDDFDAGVDPYGDAWAPLMPATLAKGRSAPPLTDTGAMRASVVVQAMAGAGISVTIDDPAVHHQYGTVHMDARPIFPNQRELPDTWQRAISDAAEEALDRARTDMGAFGG